MLLVKKCQFFLFTFDQNKPRNNAFWLWRDKSNTFFTIKNQEKTEFFQVKKCHFFLYLETRNNAELLWREKWILLYYIKNRIFRSIKNRNFFKRVNPCFLAKKCHFSLFRFVQNKTRSNAFWLCREKGNFFLP